MKRIITAIFSLILALSLVLVAAPSSMAGLLTPVPVPFCEDFEGGGIPAGWWIDGLLGDVDVLEYEDFDPDFDAPEAKGDWGALLSTGGTGTGGSGPDLDGSGGYEDEEGDHDTSTLSFAFGLAPEQVPATLSFQWSFMTSDEDAGQYDDFFMVTLNGDKILSRSCPGTSFSPFPDSPPLDGVDYTVYSDGDTDGSVFENGATSFRTFSYEINSSGSYTVEFLVADQLDHGADSGLLIDDVCVGPAAPGTGWNEGDDYKMHHPQLPELDGGQVFESSVNEEGTAGMADDFLCTESGYITDIHVWGGWYEDDFCDDASFWVGIFSNIAEDNPENPAGYSMPGELLWQRDFGPGDYTSRIWGSSDNIAYFYPMDSGYWDYIYCSNVYQYNFFIDAEDALYQEQDSIYWLSVVVTDADDEEEEDGMWWGWISCLPEDQWNDDGAWAPIDFPGEWQELFYLEYIDDNGTSGWYPSEYSADLAFVITTTPPSCEGGVIYGAAHQGSLGPSTLYTIDPATGAATAVGPIGFRHCGGLDFDDSGTLYGTAKREDGTSVLITIDPVTGAGTEVGPTGFTDSVFDLSLRNMDSNTPYVSFIGEGEDCVWLGTINTLTGAGAPVGTTLTCNPGNGIAFSPGDTLYHVNVDGDGSLYTLNTATGAASFVCPLVFPEGLDDPRINAMEFDPSSGTLYASLNDGSEGSGPNYLATVNTYTGVVTTIGLTTNGLAALAYFCPPTPVGGELFPVNKLSIIIPWLTLALLLALGGGFVVMRRRFAH